MEQLRQEMGSTTRYRQVWNYIGALIRGDFGTSWTKALSWGICCSDSRIRSCLFSSAWFCDYHRIPLGICAATHQYSWKDNAAIFDRFFASQCRYSGLR